MICTRILSLGGLGALLVFAGLRLDAAPNPPPLPPPGPRTNALVPGPRPAARTNAAARPAVPTARTNLAKAAVRPGSATNAPAGKFGLSPEVLQKLRDLPAHPAFYPAVAGVGVCLGALFLWWAFRSKPKPSDPGLSGVPAVKAAAGKRAARKSVRSCNVLETRAEARQLWQFDARGAGYVLNREQTCPDGAPLPARLVAKDWRSLFQPRLNIAWLPPEHVFLRVAQFPKSDFDETVAMVDLQMEKLSPMPVAQVVWSLQVLPQTEGNLQTVVVIIAARSVVEEFLGKLEGQGYLADSLELPLLDQLQTTVVTENGAWIYPEAAGKGSALVAWWYGGVLRNLDLLTLPPAGQPGLLKEQLTQMAWAGELEGWLTSPPSWHLVADGASEWETALRTGLEQAVEVVPPLPRATVAALTATRAARGDNPAGLLPPEYATRYRQQLVDRLWMRSLVGLFILYSLGVVVYMMFLGVASYRADQIEARVTERGQEYTNTIRLRDRLQVLQDRENLKYAALDCWNATAKLLPDSATLESLNFSGGKTLSLSGTAPADQITRLLDFEKEMRRYTVNGKPLFSPTGGRSLESRSQPQGNLATWTLALELRREEEPQRGARK